MNDIFSSIMPIFMIILLGSIIKRKWLTSEEFWRGLEKLSYFILFPTILFNSISQLNFAKVSNGQDLSFVTHVSIILSLMFATLILSFILILLQRKYNLDRKQFTSLFQGSTRYNSYIFFAIGSSLFGNDALTIIALVSAYMIIFTNILSVIILNTYGENNNEKTQKKRLIKTAKNFATNPLIISSLLGMIASYYNIEFNSIIQKTFDSISGAALPIGVLNVGSGLKFSIKSDHFKYVISSCVAKLFCLPFIAAIILHFAGIEGIARSVAILYSCLPCASSSYILSRQLGGDPESMATIVTLSTVTSLFSLSLLMYILI